jgi:hypothetical protein
VYLSQVATKQYVSFTSCLTLISEILDSSLKLLAAISKAIGRHSVTLPVFNLLDHPTDKPTLPDGLLLDIISAVVHSSLLLNSSSWTPVFIRLSAVQNVTHAAEAQVAASILGARLHMLEPDLLKAKEAARKALKAAGDQPRHKGTSPSRSNSLTATHSGGLRDAG